MIRRPPNTPLFPYPTLFQSEGAHGRVGGRHGRVHPGVVAAVEAEHRDANRSQLVRAWRAAVVDDRRAEAGGGAHGVVERSEEHTSELQSRQYIVLRLLLEKK